MIETVLGQGGFGITYGAADSTLGRRVAIKEFFPASCARQGLTVQPSSGLSPTAYRDARYKFLEEARHLARFHHSGIVAVHSVFEENNTAYMVMEYLQGQPLSQVVHERGGRMEEQEAIGIMQKVGQSLEMVHSAGLLHRDIKPDNVMVCADGRVVLIDFGTARDFAAGSTQGHTVAVTPGYAPLEQYASRAQRGIYTDVYGLAATLYFLLTGEVPTAASDRAMGVLLPPVEQLNPLIGKTVARAVMQGLEIEVAKRPQSVREFLDRLEGKAVSAARHDMTDADVLSHLLTHRIDLLQSPDPDVHRFLNSLAVDSAISAPDTPSVSPGSTTFAEYIQARQNILRDSQRILSDSQLATPQPPTAAPAQSQSLAPTPVPSDPQLKPQSLADGCSFSAFMAFLFIGLVVAITIYSPQAPSHDPSVPPSYRVIDGSPEQVFINEEEVFPGDPRYAEVIKDMASHPEAAPPRPASAPESVSPLFRNLEAKAQVLQRYQQWQNAWATRDIKQHTSLYAPEATLYRTGGVVLNYEQWRKSLQKRWDEEKRNGDKSGTFERIQGPNVEFDGDQIKLSVRQKYTYLSKRYGADYTEYYYSWSHQTVWQKRQGRWLIVEDHWTP